MAVISRTSGYILALALLVAPMAPLVAQDEENGATGQEPEGSADDQAQTQEYADYPRRGPKPAVLSVRRLHGGVGPCRLLDETNRRAGQPTRLKLMCRREPALTSRDRKIVGRTAALPALTGRVAVISDI